MNQSTAKSAPGEPVMQLPAESYQDYFQKSRTFLYPLLALPRDGLFEPEQIYRRWSQRELPQGEHALLVHYHVPAIDEWSWNQWATEYIFQHPLFAETYRLEEDGWLIVFDLSAYQSDVLAFEAGKYSLLSAKLNAAVCNYYGPASPEWAYMRTFLKPNEKIITHYARLLEVDQDAYRAMLDNGEVCNKPDPEKETFHVRAIL